MRALFLLALLVAAASARPINKKSSSSEITNSLCSTPASGMAGAYSPVDPSSVPEDLAHAVANEYLEKQGINNPACTAQVTEACTQVVAGANYKVLVQLSCPAAPGSNSGAEPMTTTLLATAFQPLPYTNKPLEVTSVEAQDSKRSSSSSTQSSSDGVSSSGIVSATLPSPTDAGSQQEQPPSNTLCPISDKGSMPGGFSPAEPADVDDEVADIVVDEFLAGNFTHNGEAFTGCEDVESKVLEACTQVVAGKNYKLLVQATCSSGAWDNGVYAVVLEATVYEPLSSSNEPLQVTSLEVQATLLTPLPPKNDLCTMPPPGMTGAFSPTDPTILPSAITQLLTDKIEAALEDTNCPDFDLSFPQACSQVVAGTNYLLAAEVRCTNGGSILGQPGAMVGAEVFQPLPYTNELPSVKALRVELF